MELQGTLPDNLRATLASIKRHRGHNVHPNTLTYWEQLFAYGRDAVRRGRASPEVADLIRQVGIELADRQVSLAAGK